jgi:hypothetical protein
VPWAGPLPLERSTSSCVFPAARRDGAAASNQPDALTLAASISATTFNTTFEFIV